MANIHNVAISGYMHYNACSFDDDLKMDEDVTKLLALMNLPVYGLRISWTGKELNISNKWGGRTCFVQYAITGREAIWSSSLVGIVNKLHRVGCVTSAVARDEDNSGTWFNIPIPLSEGCMQERLEQWIKDEYE